jgi:hypothetical protein
MTGADVPAGSGPGPQSVGSRRRSRRRRRASEAAPVVVALAAVGLDEALA